MGTQTPEDQPVGILGARENPRLRNQAGLSSLPLCRRDQGWMLQRLEEGKERGACLPVQSWAGPRPAGDWGGERHHSPKIRVMGVSRERARKDTASRDEKDLTLLCVNKPRGRLALEWQPCGGLHDGHQLGKGSWLHK